MRRFGFTHPAPGIEAGVADTRSEFARLSGTYFAIAGVVFALVTGAIAVAVARYRAGRPGAPSARHEAPVLEGAYVALVVAVVVVLVVMTFRTEGRVDAVASRPALRVDVTAAKWHWRFDYPALGVTLVANDDRSPALVVPAGQTVTFTLRSIDVVHSFWIPHERFQRSAIPGVTNRFDLRFDAPGWLDGGGECAWFCGLRHQNMLFAVRVLDAPAFVAWARAGGRG
jgi:cytochrome c oxidase subunit 2